MCKSYVNGSIKILFSGIVWLATVIVVSQLSPEQGIWIVLIGGMLIHPVSIILGKFTGLSGAHTKGNVIGNLVLEGTILLAASIQGFLLFLGLITKKTINKLSGIAISIIIFVITITILFSWGSATQYNNSKNAIPFWILQSYLLIPASFWIFFEVNTNPT